MPVKPELIRWAIDRSGRDPAALAARFGRLDEWQRGRIQPTLKPLESFAAATRTPIGYFFLPEPPEEPLPIPDFRTIGSQEVARPSPDLLDTIYLCQQRQDWYRSHALLLREDPVGFVGTATIRSDPIATAGVSRCGRLLPGRPGIGGRAHGRHAGKTRDDAEQAPDQGPRCLRGRQRQVHDAVRDDAADGCPARLGGGVVSRP